MNSCINYNYLRPVKAQKMKKWNDEPFVFRDDLKAPSYKNATILPLKQFQNDKLLFGRGGALDENGDYIDISAIDNRIQFSYEYDEKEVKNQKVVYCGYFVNHWGHFLIEAVARLWYFLLNDNSVDKYVFFVDYNENRELKGNYKEFFRLLGILDKIEIINKPTQYSEVIVPELGYKRRTYYSENFNNIFNRIAENIDTNSSFEKYDKIFFTRSQLPKAHESEFGLDMIDNYFENNGYHILAPEKLSLSEMVYLIRNSKKIACLSGTIPHNILFAQDGRDLTVIERNVLNNEIQLDVNNIKSLNVTYIDATNFMYPINIAYGPLIFSYRGLLEKYTKDNNMNPPSKRYYTDKYLRKCFAKYIKQYKKYYYYQWFMEEWYFNFTDIMYEAYVDSLKYYGDYLNGTKPYKKIQYLHPHYIFVPVRKIVKKILKR